MTRAQAKKIDKIHLLKVEEAMSNVDKSRRSSEEVRILPNFFRPGLREDVISFCHSCDVCQRTVKKGIVKKVPLGSMPLIDMPFNRVVVDIV